MTITAPARVWTFGRTGALVLAILTLIAGFALISNRAVAAFVNVAENGLPGHLSLRADPYPNTIVNPAFLTMSPGSVEYFEIGTHLIDASSPLTMQWVRDGSLVAADVADGLVVGAELCAQAWTNFPAAPTCGAPGGSDPIFLPAPANSVPLFGSLHGNDEAAPGDAPVYNLGTLTNAADKYVLVTFSIPEQEDPLAQSDVELMGLSASFGFGFTAMGDDPNLPNTGLDITALLVVGVGVLGLGLVLLSARRARIGFDEGSRS
jgi:LPXTG-motif cell wall-anchored protein